MFIIELLVINLIVAGVSWFAGIVTSMQVIRRDWPDLYREIAYRQQEQKRRG